MKCDLVAYHPPPPSKLFLRDSLRGGMLRAVLVELEVEVNHVVTS